MRLPLFSRNGAPVTATARAGLARNLIKMIQLHLGDCLELFPTIPDASIDAVIADIPYGTTACSWDTVIPFAPMWEQLKRIAKPKAAIVLFGSQPFTSALVMSNAGMFKYSWTWNKAITGNPLLAKYQPLKIHEDICVFSCNGHTYNPQMRKGKMRKKGGGYSKIWNVPCTAHSNDTYHPTSIVEFSNAQRGEHPTQKPVALMEYLIRTYTNEGDTVLDFTMGSGTTMVACVNTGRNGIGFELREDYYAIAQRRIAEAQLQAPLPVAPSF